jgi:hypothetical protein
LLASGETRTNKDLILATARAAGAAGPSRRVGETGVNLAAGGRVVGFSNSNVADENGGTGGDRAAGSRGGVGIDLLAKGTITNSGTRP